MFKSIKNMFTGGAKAPQQPAQKTFSEAEAAAIDMAHRAVHMQLHLSQAGKPGDASCKIYRAEQVTPWVVGYMSGILDYTTRLTQQEPHADFDGLKLFWELHFAPEVMVNVMAAFVSSQDALKTGGDLFGHGEQYTAGARAGFECFPYTENDTPRLDLMRELQRSKPNA